MGRPLRLSGVDRTSYDTTSVLATIQRSYGLQPVATRDARVADLQRVVRLRR